MFNLEQEISAWRKQMLAAGIQSPVPLEELELHLREEIERRIKLGLHEAQAFKMAAQNIGQGGALRNEFNKVKAGHGILRPIGLIIGWLVAGGALFHAMISLEFHWNLFNFHEKWDAETMEVIAEMLVVGIGFWFLAKTSRDRAGRIVSLLVCLFLAGFAICGILPPEALTQQAHITGSGHSSDPAAGALISLMIQSALSRHAPSPFWYRGSLTLLFFVPGIFCAWREWRHIIRKRNSQ
jgi:hypothetical protein